MIYLIVCAACAFLGMGTGLGTTVLFRPVLDAISPLQPSSIALLSTAAALTSVLASAFFLVGHGISLHRDELILLSSGSALGGVLGELILSRFLSSIPHAGYLLLQNGLLFTLTALPFVYFGTLSQTIRPLAITRMSSLPLSLVIGIAASFLSFGAEPLVILLYDLLFGAEHEEAGTAALTVALCAMAGKLITMFIRLRMNLPDAGLLLWVIPGALLGTLAAMIPAARSLTENRGSMLLRLCLFTSVINLLAAVA